MHGEVVTRRGAMFARMLIPLDGSKTAERVLTYAGFVEGALKLPIELLAVVDVICNSRR
jgi:hypothetical protein